MTGLLKCVAIELKMTAENNQISQFSHLCKILLGVVQNITPENIQLELGHYQHSLLQMDSSQVNKSGSDAKLLICQLLESLEFEVKPLDKPKWDYFDNSLMQSLFKSCEISTPGELKLLNIKKLHDILKDELNSVQNTIAAGQRQHILQEIESILLFALQMNGQRSICAANVKFLEAWSQVTEIVFSVQMAFSVALDTKQGLILEILQALLKMVVPAQIMPELANLASSTVLLLLMNLRTCYTSQKKENTDRFDSTSQLFGQSMSIQREPSNSAKSCTLSLKYILKNIIHWIIVSGVGSQKLRMNLYAALLNFFYIVKGTSSKTKLELEMRDEYYVSRLDRSIVRKTAGTELLDDNNQVEMAVEILQSFGDKLIDILCHDCTGGHEVINNILPLYFSQIISQNIFRYAKCLLYLAWTCC